MFLPEFVGGLVCLLAGLLKKLRLNFHEIFGSHRNRQ